MKIKHLEFIQGVINRFANNSFLIKGWTITVFLAGIGFFLNLKQLLALPLIAIAIFMFWLLDTFYLRQEKLYIKLYSDVADNRLVKPFDMTVLKYHKKIPSTVSIMFSYPMYVLYLPLIVITIIIYHVVCLI